MLWLTVFAAHMALEVCRAAASWCNSATADVLSCGGGSAVSLPHYSRRILVCVCIIL